MVVTYFKSLTSVEGCLGTKTFDFSRKESVPCQTLDSMLSEEEIRPNTKHSQLGDRLCVSALTSEFSGSYRPEGVLFETSQIPDYCCPVDLMALTDGDSFTSSDYDSKFVKGSEGLLFDSLSSMLRAYETPELALKGLNKVREEAGLGVLAQPFSYNECCFEDSVDISPVGLVGDSLAILEASKKFGLPVYPSTEAFVERSKASGFSLLDFTRKSCVGALYRVGASFAMDAVVLGLASGDLQGFCEDLDPLKLLRVAAYVVAINFVDYRFDVTNQLDGFVKR